VKSLSIETAGTILIVAGRMLAHIPTGRFPTAEEVAAAVVYLASPGAAGHTLVLDGGTTVC
jgi:NAD(P)-dependent dehydrogenase (short-subunit alcohol dehydrogenase family)